MPLKSIVSDAERTQGRSMYLRNCGYKLGPRFDHLDERNILQDIMSNAGG